MKALLSLFLLTCTHFAISQFDGAAGTPGSLAIHKDSSAILSWANTCMVQRGWMDASNTSLGTTSHGTGSDATGPADGTGVVSLGDSGVAVLSFNPSIANGAGPDFAVFENSFSDNFLELAFVEVSSNGVDFYRFPATSNYPTTTQIGAFDDVSDPTLVNNLAGKYRSLFGTPFDLSDLDSIQELNLNQITHVRIVDVVGSINPAYGSQDKNGNFINDPFSTPFATGGFDLDAVAVLHEGPLSLDDHQPTNAIVYPNPVEPGATLNLQSKEKIEKITITDVSGAIFFQGDDQVQIQAPKITGVYFVQIETNKREFVEKLVVM